MEQAVMTGGVASTTGSVVNIMEDVELDHDTSVDLDMSLLIAARSISEFPLDLSSCVDHEDASQSVVGADGREKANLCEAIGIEGIHDENFATPATATQDSTFLNTQTQASTLFGDVRRSLNKIRNDEARIKKRTLWAGRLEKLSRTLGELDCEGAANEESSLILKEGMKVLETAMRPNAQRPIYLYDLLQDYAIKLVELGEMLTKLGSQEFEKELPKMFRSTMTRWLNRKDGFHEYSRNWHYTRNMILHMVRYIASLKTLLAVEHALSSVLVRICSVTPDEASERSTVYACLQIGNLLNKVNEQLHFVRKDVP